MRIFAVGTKIFGGGPGQHLGGPVPPRPQRRTAPAQALFVSKITYVSSGTLNPTIPYLSKSTYKQKQLLDHSCKLHLAAT